VIRGEGANRFRPRTPKALRLRNGLSVYPTGSKRLRFLQGGSEVLLQEHWG
jgi:hypothetical protein